MKLPSHHEQIITAHAQFICTVVKCAHNESLRKEYEDALAAAESNGWSPLANAIRLIVAGNRDLSIIKGLDEEDMVIAEAVMRGMQDPNTLPDPTAKPNPTLAAPGLAGMIKDASLHPEALILMGNMADQMQKAGGSMGQLAGVLRPLMDGERDADRLCAGKDEATQKLILDILEQLNQMEAQ